MKRIIAKLRGLLPSFESTASLSSAPFRSASAAQFWYEFRQKGAALPAIASVAVCLAVLPLPIHYAMYGFRDLPHLATWTLMIQGFYQLVLVFGILFSIFAIFAGFYTGISTFRSDKRGNDPSLSELVNHNQLVQMGAFQATLPLVPFDFAAAIIRTILRSIFATWLVWFALYIVAKVSLRYVAVDAGRQDFEIALGLWVFPLTLLGPWIVMSNVASIGLTGRMGIVLASLLIAVFMIIGTVITGEAIESGLLKESTWYLCVEIFALILVISTIYAFAWAARRNLIGRQPMVLAAVLFVSVFLVAILLAPWKLFPLAYFVILGIAALAVLPIATIPLAIAWNRHR